MLSTPRCRVHVDGKIQQIFGSRLRSVQQHCDMVILTFPISHGTLNTSGANEVNFVDIRNDHFLTQISTMPTRANKTLDLVVTSVPELAAVSEILNPEKSELITDHCTILYEFSEHVKARRRIERFVYRRW